MEAKMVQIHTIDYVTVYFIVAHNCTIKEPVLLPSLDFKNYGGLPRRGLAGGTTSKSSNCLGTTRRFRETYVVNRSNFRHTTYYLLDNSFSNPKTIVIHPQSIKLV